LVKASDIVDADTDPLVKASDKLLILETPTLPKLYSVTSNSFKIFYNLYPSSEEAFKPPSPISKVDN
jgi:hypothetical protein